MELLLGAGNARDKRLWIGGKADWDHLVTLDIDPAITGESHVTWDLNNRPLPFAEGIFDEIHAYEVLEHVGRQGDWKGFFDEWSEYWRILKPNGLFFGTSPYIESPWAWGDPGHTRIVSKESFTFLSQMEYEMQVGNTPMTDYRGIYKADFEPIHTNLSGETFEYILRAVKPSRIKA